MDNKNFTLLSTVLFSQIREWDVKQFFLNGIKSIYPIEKLGSHIIHQTEKVQLSDFPNDEFIILGVSNKLGMFDASIEKGKKIKQKYHIVKENWIAYNPYRINVGSIGIKNSELKGKYISPAYVVLSCKDTLLPVFLYLLMKSTFFNSLVKDSTTGSVRQTLRFDKLANIKIPVPSVEEQQKLLNAYHITCAKAEEKAKKGDAFTEDLLTDIQSKVSDYKKENKKPNIRTSILQTIPFSSTRRWEVGFNLKESRLNVIRSSYKYKSYSIGDLQIESLFGLSIKASSIQKKGMIPMLRMGNIVNGEIDYSDLKYLPYNSAVTTKEPDKWLLKDGDMLIDRTSGSKDLVGKSAVFHSNDVYTYASYLIRYRFDTSIVLPEYINILFLTPIVREQIAVMRRQGGGQYNLNSEEIESIMIPVPPISVQQFIVNKYNSAKDNAQAYYEKAISLRQEAKMDFENAIFSI